MKLPLRCLSRSAIFNLVTGLFVCAALNGCGFSDLKNASATSGSGGTATSTGNNPTTTPTPSPVSSGETGTFTEVNTQIFQAKCVQCHGSGSSPDLTSYSSFATNTKYIVSGNPASSLIYQYVASGSMPQGGTPLTSAELSLVSAWITAGALNN